MVSPRQLAIKHRGDYPELMLHPPSGTTPPQSGFVSSNFYGTPFKKGWNRSYPVETNEGFVLLSIVRVQLFISASLPASLPRVLPISKS